MLSVNFSQNGQEVNITYIANEGFLIESGGHKILIDAFIESGFNVYLEAGDDDKRKLTNAQAPFDDIDYLLITHYHRDHFEANQTAAHLLNNGSTILVAPPQAVDSLKKLESFSQFQNQICLAPAEFGGELDLTKDGISIHALCVNHSPYMEDGKDRHAQVQNIAYSIELDGIRFLHFGDATLSNSYDLFKADEKLASKTDFIFLEYFDVDSLSKDFVKEILTPSHKIFMHVPPAHLEKIIPFVEQHYSDPIIFKNSMEAIKFNL